MLKCARVEYERAHVRRACEQSKGQQERNLGKSVRLIYKSPTIASVAEAAMETAASETGTETGTGTGRNVDVTMFVVPHQLYSVVARVLQPRQTCAC